MDLFKFCIPPLPKQTWLIEDKKLFEPLIVGYQSDRWAHILCSWHEKRESHSVLHDFAPCLDLKEPGLYIDCRPRLIFFKCVIQLLVRPFFGLVKTAYQISLIPVFHEIAKIWIGNQEKRGSIKNALRAIADIVRTPLFQATLIITSIAVLILGAVKPLTLYEGRSLLGKLEQQANWGEKHTFWTLTDCFQPFPLSILDSEKFRKRHKDTIYDSEDELEVRLSNFARSYIKYKRKHRDLSGHKLDPHQAYVSPILIQT